MNLFNELKRRNVFRVGAAYLVVAWLIAQVISVVNEPLNLPGSFDTIVILVLLLGFPIALVIAWAFELTPEGIKPTSAVSLQQSITPETGTKLNRLIITALSLAVIILVADNYVFTGDQSASITLASATNSPIAGEESLQSNTIAIIPFVNISDDPSQEYFSDGLTEEMINKLSRVDGLLVTGRDSAFYFKGRENERDEIREKLGVNYLLQGSVRKGNSEIRINAQLLNLQTNQTLWSQTYDRELSDVLAVQDDIGGEVTRALSVTLQAGDFDRPGMTRDPETYDAYLKIQELSRNMTNQLTRENRDALIAQSELVVSMDPEFALGWYQLWQIYTRSIGVLSSQSDIALFTQRRDEALQRARALEPALPELMQAGMLDENSRRNWLAAEQYASSLQDSFGSRDPELNLEYINLLHNLGRINDSMRFAQQGTLLDPLNPFTHWRLASTYLLQGRIDETRTAVERGLALDSGAGQFLEGHMVITAWVENDRELMARLSGSEADIAPEVTRLWLEGSNSEALDLVRSLSSGDDLVTLDYIVYSEWAAVLGDPDLALALSYRHMAPQISWLTIFSEMRKLPGFRDFVRDMGLYDYWRTTGNWGDFCKPLPDSDTDFECF